MLVPSLQQPFLSPTFLFAAMGYDTTIAREGRGGSESSSVVGAGAGAGGL